ncbi:MAG: SIR2 family protein [Rhodoferax sp.]|uniref:SIR2 family protein n=1 Tax=Rhodoferax sp. TaxID=50421 RepID=UPI00262898F0|nr:SIR2 family protein [Rhodoferax sp.]MDD5336187.1 SIR2 family protein [Rhodoferax sp.]
MLSSDNQTYAALQALTDAGERRQRPIVFWIGAGASAWAGFPLWQELASKMHSHFARTVSSYEKQSAAKALADGRFPAVFQYMKAADRASYYGELARTFGSSDQTPVYARMLRSLTKTQPLHILTTNVDETLERSLDSTMTVQCSDVERINLLVQSSQSFVCKLHGTSSAVESMVFSNDDYLRIVGNATYLAAIRELFSIATVVFIGYSLRDDYLIQLLLENDTNRPLFGTGPHFLITASEEIRVPESVKQIRYRSEFADHRDALLALEVLAEAWSSTRTAAVPDTRNSGQVRKRPKSVYYLADLLPPVGTIQTSQTAIIGDIEGNSKGQMIVGDGYVQSEIQITNYSALHDLIVGLLCFDNVYFAANRISVVHNLLGSEVFWELVQSDALKVVNVIEDTCVLFSDEHSAVGHLADVTPGDRDNANDPRSPVTLEAVIRRHLTPVPGQEKVAEEYFRLLAKTAINVSSTSLKNAFSDQTGLALVSPSIRGLLGMSRGTPHQVIPRWLAFPVLRLARVMTIGTVCRAIEASAARMILGVERLATAAFASAPGKSWADDSASYVLTGRSNSDLGTVVSKTPGLLQRLVAFRSSSHGEAFRKELAESLQTDRGAQVAAAVNSGLKQALTQSVLDQARNQFSGLFTSNEATNMMPAVWGNLENGEIRIAKWRERSRGLLQEEIRKHKFSPYSACPCGSGEQLKFCCLAALSRD